MTRLWRPRMLVLALLLSLGSSSFADGQESIRHSFQSLAGQVVAEFQRATDGIRKPHFDIRRRGTFPDVNAEMVGMLKFEMKPKGQGGGGPGRGGVRDFRGRGGGVRRLHRVPPHRRVSE